MPSAVRFRLLALALLVVVGVPRLPAQDSRPPISSRTLRFRITEVLRTWGDSAEVRLETGKGSDLEAGMPGQAYGVKNDSLPKRGGSKLGPALLSAVDSSGSNVLVRLLDPAAPAGRIYPGDLISLEIEERYPPTAGLLSELVSRRIEFYDDDEHNFYAFWPVLLQENDSLRTAVFTAMAADMHAVAKRVEATIAADDAMRTPATSGRFQGRKPLEVMAQATPEDLRRFTDYVTSYPGSFLGRRLFLGREFASWLLGNSLPGREGAWEDLFALPDDAARRQSILAQEDALGDGVWIDYWNEIANQWAKDGRAEEARAAVHISWLIADSYKLIGQRGWSQFYLAQIEHHTRNREAAIAAYRTAIPDFTAAHEDQGVAFALNNIADELNLLNRYVESAAIWDTVVALERTRSATDDSPAQRKSLAMSLNGAGDALAKIDRYDDALSYYEESAGLFGGLRTHEGDRRRAGVLHDAAEVHSTRGAREKALALYQEARAIYHRQENVEGEADQLDEIAFQRSQMGERREAIALWDTAYTLHMQSGELGDAGYSKSQIGQSSWTLGEVTTAIAAHTEAVKLREQANDRSGMAYSLDKLAQLYRESGDPTKALSTYEQVAKLYGDLEQLDKQAGVLNSMGDVFYNERDYPRAVAQYHRSRVLFERLQTPRDLALTYYDLGDAFYQQSTWDSAAAYYSRAITIQRDIGDEPNLVPSLNSLGYVSEFGLHDRAAAERLYREALTLATKLGAKASIASCYAALARSSAIRGAVDSAMVFNQRALDLYRELEDRREESLRLAALGDNLVQRGDLTASLDRYRQALTVAEAAGRRTEMASALTSMSWVHHLVGDYDKALEAEQRSREISLSVNNPWGLASSYNGLGGIHQARGNYREAIGYFQQADSIYRVLNDTLAEATPINNIGVIYFWQADYPRALAQFNQSLAILRRFSTEGEFYPLLLGNIGEVYYEQGNFAEADRWLRQALEVARAASVARTTATVLTLLGKNAQEQGHLEEADGWFQAADTLTRRMQTPDHIAEILTQQGRLAYTRKDLPLARTRLEEAVRMARSIGATKYLWEPLYYLGQVQRDAGDSAAAQQAFLDAVSAIEELRGRIAGGEGAAKIFSTGRVQGRLYEALVSLLIGRGKVEEALAVLDRSMNEELRDKFRGLNIHFADPKKAQLLAEEQRLKARVDGTDAQLATALAAPDSGAQSGTIRTLRETRTVVEREYLEFVNRMVREQPDLKNHTRVNLREFIASKRNLPKDVALLTYLPGEQELYVFVITSDAVVAKVVPLPREVLDHQVEIMVQLARSPSATMATVQRSGTAPTAGARKPEGDVRAQSIALYRSLIAPVAAEIGTRSRLAIVPSGSLYYLPFQILGDSIGGSFRTLAEDRTIFYVTELQVPPTGGTRAHRAPMSLAAFGNADSTLPSAEREVNDLKRLFPAASIFLRGNATETRAKNLPASFSVVHFATHGNLDYQDFEQSYLTLAPGPGGKDDGRLTLSEVWGMTGFSGRRMVVLSACNTAVSEEKVAGWPNSPATAFLDIGVPTVVASLWPVDDAATSILITAFYRNLRATDPQGRPKMDAAEALRQAQLAVRADPKYAHPYYWGAWVLVGDPR